MRTLEVLPEASDEAIPAIGYYEERQRGLGARLRREIETGFGSIVNNPMLWRERTAGYRRLNLTGFPFYIAYFMRKERVIVAAIAHSSREPDYWKRRVTKITS
jgi:plasmid stabilization system protein ParE